MRLVPLESLDSLKQISESSPAEIHLMLDGGGYSSKLIQYNKQKGTWYIINEIDGTEQTLADDDALWWDSNIGYWLANHAIAYVVDDAPPPGPPGNPPGVHSETTRVDTRVDTQLLKELGDPIGGLDLMARLLDLGGFTGDMDNPNVAAMLHTWAEEARSITGK